MYPRTLLQINALLEVLCQSVVKITRHYNTNTPHPTVNTAPLLCLHAR